ncbi:hypothetical protein GMORB2_3883 [Geosmithia morbida]|uniref:Uncharacterized protein n=1 Tax=Geosmithia morbida TaxID=1094350 RepID=A0A9P5D807_9HYPO|nr:uncharacterized protein GMORB2_3883 [Geosmithia morbida]KAF4125044.1 hypothetical protein GMORB2_3883 [Geosmithia morbida]
MVLRSVTVSSFNYPARADASLLTPVSTENSPPMHPNHKFSEGYAPHGVPPPPPHQQQPDEPSPVPSRTMYPWYPLDMNGQSSQEGSPVAPGHQTPVSQQEFLTPSYLGGPQTHQHRRLTPGPPDNVYTGSYGVSDATDQQQQQQQHHHHHNHDHHQHHSLQASNHHHHHPDAQSQHHNYYMHVPDQPLPPPPPLIPREGSSLAAAAAVPAAASPSPEMPRSSNRRKSAAVAGQAAGSGSRQSRKARSGGSGGGGGGGSHAANQYPLEEHQNCHGQEVPPRLKPNCPPEERCIFEARWENRRKKGHDMWESIQAAFEQKFEQKFNKEMLQMRFTRARAKYYDWLPEDDELLREAFLEMEKERYENLLDRFYEKGGSRNMQLSASDIEIKLATDLKLEEGFYIETQYPDLHVRRRQKKTSARRRQQAAATGGTTSAAAAVRGIEEGVDGNAAGAAGGNDDIVSVGSHNTANEDES